jgi:hypothetical protein
MLCDIYLLAMSDKILSNSLGGYIILVKKCNENKNEIIKQFTKLNTN